MSQSNYTSSPIPVPPPDELTGARHAVIEIGGLEQGGESFELRVFLNRPDADAETPDTPESGYAGSIHVYGYGLSPTEASEGAAVDEHPSHAPMRRMLIATEAVRRAAAQGRTATVTAVPVPAAGTEEGPQAPIPVRDALSVDSVSIYTEPD